MLDLLENYVASNEDEGWMTMEMAKEDLRAFDTVIEAPELPSVGNEEPARKKKAYTVDKKTLLIPESDWKQVSRCE
jgi:formiminotetrahydrofolate cyclodeaminase